MDRSWIGHGPVTTTNAITKSPGTRPGFFRGGDTLIDMNALFATLAVAAFAIQPAAPAPPPSSHAATFARYAVAADHHLASAAGAEILAKGGNAVDAAVATSFALAVVRPFSCGLGGGGFMVIALPDNPRTPAVNDVVRVAIDYRETAPAAVGPDYFSKLAAERPDASTRGGTAAGIPGTVAGLLSALDRFGTLDRAVVLAPAIRLARGGFAADRAYMAAAESRLRLYEKDAGYQKRFGFLWRVYLREGRVALGDVIRNPDQAEALELIARDGAAAFYHGAIADAIALAVQADGGGMTKEDLAGYEPVDAVPLEITFEKRLFLTMPPPSSGGLALAQTLGILERVNIRQYVGKPGAEATPQLMVLVAEAFKHAFADRAEWLGDPAFVDVPTDKLLSGEYLDARAKLVDVSRTHGPEYYGTRGIPPKDDGGTSHLCVIDAAGGAVACTETINLEFGSMLAVEPFGFLLNNQMDDFTTASGQPNAFGLTQSDRNLAAPGKRPLSSMSPTIVLDEGGVVKAVAGASGGPRIITGTALALLYALVLEHPAGQAVAEPRIHHQWLPNVLEVEKNFPGKEGGLPTAMWLRKLGHEVRTPTRECAVQLIVRTPEGLQAACDPRKGGVPAGE